MVAYSFKRRFVMPIRAGLGLIGMTHAGKEIPCELVLDDGAHAPRKFDPMVDLDPPVRPKRQTIRALGKRRHARPGETLQLYTGMRTRQCEKIGDARCVSVEPIKLWVSLKHVAIEKGRNPIDDDFARKDGFEGAKEMHAFWIAEHGAGEFEGVLIKWETL